MTPGWAWVAVVLGGCAAEPTWFYVDEDGDGFGGEAWTEPTREAPEGAVATGGDCDDADPAIHPGADETCDGVDNDCSGATDEPFDDDGDGDSECGADCDDADPRVSGALPEVCDRVDNDCDGTIDETKDGEPFDADGDGWSVCRGDCDDTHAARFPSNREVCDGVDNDCDDATPEALDGDGDGVAICGGDCDDTNSLAASGFDEVCDGVDHDCDGFADELLDCSGCSRTGPYTTCAEYRRYDVAVATCEQAGFQLVVFETPEEDLAVSELAYYTFYDASWIGLDDLVTEGVFEWIDDSPTPYTAWWEGEPNDSGGEDCAGTNYGDIGYWNDFQCKAVLPFVCEDRGT